MSAPTRRATGAIPSRFEEARKELEDAAGGDLVAFLRDALEAADTRNGKEAAN